MFTRRENYFKALLQTHGTVLNQLSLSCLQKFLLMHWDENWPQSEKTDHCFNAHKAELLSLGLCSYDVFILGFERFDCLCTSPPDFQWDFCCTEKLAATSVVVPRTGCYMHCLTWAAFGLKIQFLIAQAAGAVVYAVATKEHILLLVSTKPSCPPEGSWAVCKSAAQSSAHLTGLIRNPMIGMRSIRLIPFTILKELFTNFPALYSSAEKAD